MGHRKLQAVVLRTTDYGESDRVVALLSEEHGRLSAFARGARASRRRFGGALEPFTLLTAELRERPGAELWGLESVSVQRGFGAIRGDLSRIACAGYACDLCRALVRDHEPHPELFADLVALLALLDEAPARPETLRAFELMALRDSGLSPRLDGCARCGAPLPASLAGLAWSPEGGLVCGSCRTGLPRAVPCSPAAASALLALAAGGLAAGPLPAGVGAEVRDLLSRFVEQQVGGKLPSRKFLDEVGPLLR
jgi:DNA repair protein RecO (recombination protein O)